MEKPDCFHIVDIRRRVTVTALLTEKVEARLVVTRGYRDTTGADTASVDLPGGTQSIQRAVAVLRILATAAIPA
jgi:hypothetical protein